MIWAVGAGILILFSILLFFFTGGGSPSDKLSVMKNTLSYIKKTEGIIDLVFIPEENTVKIIFEPDPNSRSGIDYEKLSAYAGVKLSNKLKEDDLTIFLVRDKTEEPVLVLKLKNGRITNRSQPGS